MEVATRPYSPRRNWNSSLAHHGSCAETVVVYRAELKVRPLSLNPHLTIGQLYDLEQVHHQGYSRLCL